MQGILIIDKPIGYSSQNVVSKVKRILNIKKAGHTGTLDPLATGVLPIMLGNYTKLSKYLIEHDKTYVAKIKLGKKSSTGDLEGKIIDSKHIDTSLITENYVKEILNTFIGKQKQIPPIYSAIKLNGKKLYEFARNNEEIKVPARDIEIHSIRLIKIVNNEIEFEVNCSKGTYIRTLCQDIAEKIGTIGMMIALKRVKVDNFNIDDSVTLEELEKMTLEDIEKILIKMEDLFPNSKDIKLNQRKTELFLNGVMLTHIDIDGIYNVYNEKNEYLGTGLIKNNLLKRDVIVYENV